MTEASSVPTLICVVGARPNFMKIAPIMRALRNHQSSFKTILVHTGQHYDETMNQQFFEALEIPTPEINLEVGSASHTVQTAEIMRRFEPVVDAYPRCAILVVGDVNSTIACALVAAKKNIPIIHVEAGLRSLDRSMPEEINRVLTDQISDVLFITERSARDNLLREGIDDKRIHFVGNVMIDTLQFHLKKAVPPNQTFARLGISENFLKHESGYAVVTLHRPSNVDNPTVLEKLLDVLDDVSHSIPVFFPMHPRTRGRIDSFGFSQKLNVPNLVLLPALGYLEMLGIMKDAKVMLTDSGGIQEETTALGVPCLTLRLNTERPITVTEGTNTIVGEDPSAIMNAFHDVLNTGGKAGRVPELWDGNAAGRIAATLDAWITEHFEMREENSATLATSNA